MTYQSQLPSLKLISFDTLRTLGIPIIQQLKPETWFRHKDNIKSADWLLFPDYSQVNTLVYGWKKRIFPSISSYHLGHDKVEMTQVFETLFPANTPFTRILAATEAGIEQALDEFCYPFIAKEIRSSMGRGVHLIENRADFFRYVHSNSVLYLQEYLPIRRDLRIVYVGDRVVACYWREAPDGCFLNNVAQGAQVYFDDIPEGAIRLVEQVAETLGINHAGFDIAEVDGHFFLLEFNVRFGTQTLNSLGIKLGPIIFEYLIKLSAPLWEPDNPLPKAS